jgi:integrase
MTRRLHSTLGDVPPEEFETAYYAHLETPSHPVLAPRGSGREPGTVHRSRPRLAWPTRRFETGAPAKSARRGATSAEPWSATALARSSDGSTHTMGRPRREAGWGTIRFHQKGEVWHADGRHRDASGADRRHRAHGRSPEIAELRLRARIANGGSEVVISETTTLTQLSAFWLRERERDVDLRLADPVGRAGVAPQTVVKYRSDLESVVLPRIGSALLGELRAVDLELVLRDIQRESQPMARRARGLLRQMLDEAVRIGAIPVSPLAPARRVRRATAAPVAYNRAQLNAIRAIWADWISIYRKPGPKPNADILDALLVSAATSMRIGEVLALRPADLALDARPPHLVVSGTLVEVESIPLHRQGHPKDARQTRAIRLPEAAITILRRRIVGLAVDAPIWSAAGVRTPTRQGTEARGTRADAQPWRSPHNVRRTVRAFRSAMEGELRAAGIDPARLVPKSMRSTAATAVAHSLSPEHAAALAGHRSVAVAFDHYIAKLQMIDGGQADVLNRLLGDQ